MEAINRNVRWTSQSLSGPPTDGLDLSVFPLTRPSSHKGGEADLKSDTGAMPMGMGDKDEVVREAYDGMALNVQDIDAYWLRFSCSSDLSAEGSDLPVTMKRGDLNDTPKRRSKRLAEQARLESLRQRKIAHRGHKIGDTQEDPLFIPLDEEKEVVVLLPPKSKVSSPVNPNYDSDYQEFLAEFLADEPPVIALPTPPPAAKPDASPSPTPAPTSPWIDPPSPLNPVPSSVTGDSPVRAPSST
nr:DExH-box ATP-dependent RNA helicase DExH12 [Ipomoea batatas]